MYDNGVLEVKKKKKKSIWNLCTLFCQRHQAELLQYYVAVVVKLVVFVAVLFRFKVSYSFLCNCHHSHFLRPQWRSMIACWKMISLSAQLKVMLPFTLCKADTSENILWKGERVKKSRGLWTLLTSWRPLIVECLLHVSLCLCACVCACPSVLVSAYFFSVWTLQHLYALIYLCFAFNISKKLTNKKRNSCNIIYQLASVELLISASQIITIYDSCRQLSVCGCVMRKEVIEVLRWNGCILKENNVSSTTQSVFHYLMLRVENECVQRNRFARMAPDG